MPKQGHITHVILGYTAFVGVWFISWLTIGDQYWPLVILNRLVPYLLLPAGLFLVITITRRQLGLTLVACLPLLIFLYLYAPHFQPKRIVEEDVDTIRVMTFNVLFSNQNYQEIAALLQAYQPDLVALQEVKPKMLAELNNRLADHFPYSYLAPAHDYGTTAILSKYPFSTAAAVPLGIDRPASVVELQFQDLSIQFISAHLVAYGLQNHPPWDMPAVITARTRAQNAQAEALLGSLQAEAGVIQILGCDCNSKETSSTYRILATRLVDASREVGIWFGKPLLPGEARDLNLQHIDYILYQGPLTPLTTRTLAQTAGSDHRPLLAEFAIIAADQ